MDSGGAWMVVNQGADANQWLWMEAVRHVLLDLREQGKIGSSDTPHVPYLDAN